MPGSEDSGPVAAEEPRRKTKLPFKRTVARKPAGAPTQPTRQEGDDDNDLDLFRRSKDFFPEFEREAEEEAREKQQQQEQQQRHKEETTPRKKRKLSSGSGGWRDSPRKDRHRTPTPADDSAVSFQRSPDPLALDDDLIMDVKGKGKETTKPQKPRQPSISLLSDGSDDEFTPRHSRQRSTPRKPASSTPIKHTDSPAKPKAQVIADSDSDIEEITPPTDLPDPDLSRWIAAAQERERELAAAQSKDDVFNLIITSPLPNTHTVMARRKISQNFKVVLETWIRQQHNLGDPIPEDQVHRYFLTWKGKKIYSFTTAASLGLEVDPITGNLKRSDGDGFHKGGLLLEVFRDDVYAEYLRDVEREREKREGILIDDDDDSSGEKADETGEGVSGGKETAPEKRGKGVKVVLVAKNLEPLKITVHMDTTIQTMMEAFKIQRKLDANVSPVIIFDGERLDPESLVEDVDVDPDDTNQFEVHVKAG